MEKGKSDKVMNKIFHILIASYAIILYSLKLFSFRRISFSIYYVE